MGAGHTARWLDGLGGLTGGAGCKSGVDDGRMGQAAAGTEGGKVVGWAVVQVVAGGVQHNILYTGAGSVCSALLLILDTHDNPDPGHP